MRARAEAAEVEAARVLQSGGGDGGRRPPSVPAGQDPLPSAAEIEAANAANGEGAADGEGGGGSKPVTPAEGKARRLPTQPPTQTAPALSDFHKTRYFSASCNTHPASRSAIPSASLCSPSVCQGIQGRQERQGGQEGQEGGQARCHGRDDRRAGRRRGPAAPPRPRGRPAAGDHRRRRGGRAGFARRRQGWEGATHIRQHAFTALYTRVLLRYGMSCPPPPLWIKPRPVCSADSPAAEVGSQRRADEHRWGFRRGQAPR